MMVPCGLATGAAPALTHHPPLVLLAAAIDVNKNGTVERSEFADFIFHMAVADLRSVSSTEEA